MCFFPTNLKDWTTVITDLLGTLFVVIGGGWGLWQYFKGTQLKAAETLLKVEEEFREVFPTYEQLEDGECYEHVIKPVLESESAGKLDPDGLKKLTKLDRCLRFLFLCSVLNDTLHVDRTFGVKGGVLRDAYYYYIGILLKDNVPPREELLRYTEKYYPRLTKWVDAHKDVLRKLRPPPNQESVVGQLTC